MRYWPVSAMLNSPALRPEQKLELINWNLCGISQHTMYVCHMLARQMQGCDIVLLYTEDMPLKRTYASHPTQDEWLALERCGFVDTGWGFGFNVEALH